MSYPKIELHVHLEGTVRPRTLLEIARRNDYALPADTEEGLAELYEFRDFAHFIEVWILTTNALRRAEDFRQVVLDYAAEAVSHGAVYVEAIFSPAERVRRGVGWDEIFSGYCDGAAEARERYGLELRLTPDIVRGFPMEDAEQTVRYSAKYRERGIVGVGLGGLEAEYPPEPYERVFALAREEGLGLLREIADRRVVLDVCPISNLRTRAVGSLEEHPLPQLVAAGVRCSISTDDPAMFGTDLSSDCEAAVSLGLDPRDFLEAGVEGALCDEETKERLRAVGEEFDWESARLVEGQVR